MGYKKILLALSLDSNAYQLLIKKAKELVGEKGVEFYLIHAIEHMSGYGFTYGISAGVDVEDILFEEAKQSLKRLFPVWLPFGLPDCKN
ncbi:MAG: hypothetical protein AB8Z16_00525 [Coxiella endosymbiont of Haemaphysalis qinghaiensis]